MRVVDESRSERSLCNGVALRNSRALQEIRRTVEDILCHEAGDGLCDK